MKRMLLTGVILIIGIWYISIPFFGSNKNTYFPKATPAPTQIPQNMKLTSTAFASEEKIPAEFTCDGAKIHPPLTISGIPNNTKSLSIIIDDPDAPSGTFNHWVVWNISPDTTEIPAGMVPQKSQEGTNSAGNIGFTPPCPPSGSHRYFFTVYALDTTIGLDGKSKKDAIISAMNGHILEQTNLIGSYARISR